ncbi:uncharacterized protein [Rutidosis leptorrhynchoides]|uniref:uncharacterized protein n=1 Tax=Rutidosis leptorrhynchoides TaxID=125765 RepID=UPI003A99310F
MNTAPTMTENNKDSNIAVESSSNASLKEALFAQQQLLQKLYNELEVERESSATAASEALAMILRLQGEKAAVKMESEQYKRLSEEKMYHAEESMEIFEDLIYQKEIEIANLDYQVQAYRYRLSSLGLEEVGSNAIKFPENLLQLNETSVTETSPENLSRRNSAPPKLIKMAYLKRGNLERNRSVSPESESEKLDESQQSIESDKQMDGSISSYWDQLRKLDKIVEEIAGDQYPSLKGRSSRSSDALSQLNESDQAKSSKKLVDEEINSDACSLNVLDVFEVPETNENIVTREKQSKLNGKSVVGFENKVEKLVNLSTDVMTLKQNDMKMFLPRDNIVVDCRMEIDRASTDVVESQGSSQLANITTEITQGEGQDVISQEVSNTEREDIMRLLNKINEKLDCIQSEIRNGKTESKKSTPDFDLPMLQLTEAMLHFWL